MVATIRCEQQASWSNYYTISNYYMPHLLPWHGCPNQMWATGIMNQLLFARSVVLGVVAPIRCEQQESWGCWRMILLASSVVLTWLLQSGLSNKDQRTVTLLQWMNSYRNLTTFLYKGLIVVSEDCTLLLIILQVLFYLNIVETEHSPFFREYIVIFYILSLLLIFSELYSIISCAYS
jgi:hypothetical protein